jgi:hypothetical protein
MFNDDFSDDFSDEFENSNSNNDDPMSEYQLQVEKEFFRALEKGENISIYLYFPHMLISEKVKEHLDIYLLNEAYKNMFEVQEEIDAIYQDSQLSIIIKDEDFKEQMLNQMLDFFVQKEEYEKCARIKNELEKMKSITKNKINGQES